MSQTVDFKKISRHKGPLKSPGFLLWKASTTWRSILEAKLKPYDLTHPQFVMLACTAWLTREGEHTTQIAVGKMASLDPNTTSQVLRGLEKKGLITRKESPTDTRAKSPALTATGRKRIEQALPIVEAADKGFFGQLSKEDRDLLLKLHSQLGSVNDQ